MLFSLKEEKKVTAWEQVRGRISKDLFSLVPLLICPEPVTVSRTEESKMDLSTNRSYWVLSSCRQWEVNGS